MADIQAQLPDGTILSFPEGTPDSVIDNTVRQQIQAQAQVLATTPGVTDPSIQPEPPQGPSVSERLLSAAGSTVRGVPEALTTLAGLPVDVLTGVINFASESLTGERAIDPEQAAFGSASQERFIGGTRAGLRNVGRGVGLVDRQTEEEIAAQRAQTEQSLGFAAGELFGEVGTFALPAGGLSKIGSLIPRALTTGALAGLEGLIIARGRGQTIEDIQKAGLFGGGLGVSLEILSPIIGRIVNSIFRRVTGRAPEGPLVDANQNPTEELQKVFDDAGISPEDVQGQVMREIQQGAIPEQAERAARFQAQGIPTTKGVITQDDVLLGREETILGRVDELGEFIGAPLRERARATSAAFERNAQEIIDDLGLPDDVGNSVKDALTQRRKLLLREKNDLYRLAGEADPELLSVPILPDNIIDAIPDRKTFNRINRIKGSQAEGVQDLLVEFGLDQDEELVEAFLKTQGNEITPLSFSNFEDFRQGLLSLGRADQTGATSVLINPITDILDKELDIAFKAMSNSRNVKATTLDLLKQARTKVRELKIEFDPKGTTDRLISFKKGGNIPNIEASQVYKSIAGPSVSIEATERLVKSLSKGGKVGRKALGDLQAATVMEALDKAISTTSNRSGGRQLFSATAFVNQLKRIGQRKLDIIFSNNPGMLRTLRNLEKSARETVTPGTTKPKGSAPAANAILGVLSGVRALPLLRGVFDAVEVGVSGTKARGALDVTPQKRKTIEFIQREYPALASVLGAGVIARGETNDQ